MARLYVNPETDSIYLDVTAGGCSPVAMEEAAEGVYLHHDQAGMVVAVEIMDLGWRGRLDSDQMGHIHVNAETDALYLDVSAGTSASTRMAAVAEGVFLHEDEHGTMVGVEMLGLRGRGGLKVDDLDAPPESPRPAVFDEIERAASGQRPDRPNA